MTGLPIAQVAFGLYVPILVLLAGYAVVSLLAGIARNREENERAERLADISFLLVVLGAAYAVVLLIVSAVSYPSRVYDMILIIFVVVVFFGLLLFLFFAVSELLPRTLRRRQR